MTAPSPALVADPRAWADEAVRRIEADARRSADTHLIRLEPAATPGVTLYLKDESSHPTGSLKHRLARSLFLYALCNGWLRPDTCVVEASSGSTAVSEAYFARLVGLRFVAVVPAGTAAAKLAAIRTHGGEVREAACAASCVAEARRLAAGTGGHFMDQFTHAERATDWRGNNNVAESLFGQMAMEEHPVPDWIVCGAGTGGTSATFGRYIRYRRLATRLCVADPAASVFHRHWADRTVTAAPAGGACSVIEGIGRPRVEPSFLPAVIDRTEAVADADSLGAMRALSDRLGRRVGGSTGTNLWACLRLAGEMAAAGREGGVATLLCDGGERYADSFYDDRWCEGRGLDWRPAAARTAAWLR